MRRLFSLRIWPLVPALALVVTAQIGLAQTAIQQVGPVTAGHAAVWWANGQLVDGAYDPVSVNSGGTGATTAAGARANLGAAASGVNNDIVSLTGLLVSLPLGEGGTGSTTAAGARTNLGLGDFATQNYETPPAIGGTTPNTGAFSALTDTGVTGVANNCAYFDANGQLHGTGGTCTAAAPVSSVFGRTGAVTLLSTDISGAGGMLGANNGTDFTSIPTTLNNLAGLPHVANTTALAAFNSTNTQVVRDGFSAAGDAPPLAYTYSASPCSSADNGAQVTRTGGGCWLANFPSAGSDIREFGAKCDGATDDAAAIKAAIAYLQTKGGGDVIIPAGLQCKFASTLSVTAGGVRIRGYGALVSTLLCATGANDCIDIGFQAGQVNQSTLENLTVDGSSLTGGYAVSIKNVYLPIVRNLIINNAWGGVKTEQVNTAILDNVQANQSMTVHSGGVPVFDFYDTATNAERSDSITLMNSVAEANYEGGDCLVIDGETYDVRLLQDALLNCRYGAHIENSAASGAYYPEFVFANDLEIDGNTITGFQIDGGAEITISGSDIDNNNASATGNPLVINPDTSYSYTHGILISNTKFHDTLHSAAVINARQVTISSSQFFDSNHVGTSTYPQVEIGANSDGVSIGSSFVGEQYGDATAPTYGVTVDSGAVHVALAGLNYNGATTGEVDDLAGTQVSISGGTDHAGNPINPLIATGGAGATNSLTIANPNTSSGTQSQLSLSTGTANAYAALSQSDGATPEFIFSSGPGDTGGFWFLPSAGSLQLRPGTGGNDWLWTGSALATTATSGFVAIQGMNGIPTGTPTGSTTSAPFCVIDSTDQKLECYIGASWYHLSFTPGA